MSLTLLFNSLGRLKTSYSYLLCKIIKKKIGKNRMHTLNRLQKHGILLFKDELQLQELKFIWKWENKK